MSRLKTTYFEQTLDRRESRKLYVFLRDNVEWEEGVRSRYGPTRLAKPIALTDSDPISRKIAKVVLGVLKKHVPDTSYYIFGTYLNYYKNGEMYTPNHSHPGTHQLVISLGAIRTLTVGKKSYDMKSGDAILFGSSTHGVPKDENVDRGRISIATFMKAIS